MRSLGLIRKMILQISNNEVSTRRRRRRDTTATVVIRGHRKNEYVS